MKQAWSKLAPIHAPGSLDRSRTQLAPPLDPWKLVWGQPYIDSRALARAIEEDLERSAHPDFRTRLLVRDAAVAIRSH